MLKINIRRGSILKRDKIIRGRGKSYNLKSEPWNAEWNPDDEKRFSAATTKTFFEERKCTAEIVAEEEIRML